MNSGSQNSNQVSRHPTPTCRHVDTRKFHAMSGTIFFICWSWATSAFSAALRISAWPAAPERWRRGCKNRKVTTWSWQSQSRRRWTCPSLSLRFWTDRSRRQARGYWKHPVEQIGQVTRKTSCKRSQSRRSVEFSRMANRCISERKYREICRDRRPGTPGISPEESVSTGKLVAPGYPGTPGNSGDSETWGKWRRIATQSPYFITLCAVHAHEESLLDRETKIWSQVDGSDAKTSMCTQRYVVYLCQSLFKLQFILGKKKENLRSTKDQRWKSLKQLLQVTERLITDQTELTDHDWLTAAYVDTDYPADSQSCSICNCKNLRFFCLSAMSGRYQFWTCPSIGKQDLTVFWKYVISKIWIEPTGSQWSSSGKIPRIHNIADSRRDPKHDD